MSATISGNEFAGIDGRRFFNSVGNYLGIAFNHFVHQRKELSFAVLHLLPV